MAVFTPVTRAQLAHWLERYDLGELLGFEGIASGIENSNFFVTTSAGRFVLTLFERLGNDELRFYLGLMHHLAARGIPCPDPVADRAGVFLGRLEGKPAALVTRLAGHAVVQAQPAHCAQVGALLARMHRAALGYESRQPNPRGMDWKTGAAPEVLPFLDGLQSALMVDELAQQQAFAASTLRAALPSSAVHADLFRDNVLFDGLPGHEKLTGVLDFFFAGTDAWLFDIAVCLNDWCTDLDSGRLDEQRATAFVAAYGLERALEAVEHRLMPAMLRAAAFRFWLSRLWDRHLPRAAELLDAHDPAHFERVLRERIASPWHPAR